MAKGRIEIREEKVMVEEIKKKEVIVLELSKKEAVLVKVLLGNIRGINPKRNLTDGMYYALKDAGITDYCFENHFKIVDGEIWAKDG